MLKYLSIVGVFMYTTATDITQIRKTKMLKYLFLIGVVTYITATDIPRLRVYEIETLEDFGFKIKWIPLKYDNDENPIIGVKVKLWRVPCEIKTTNHHFANGTVMRIVKSERLRFTDTTFPQEPPEQVLIVTPDQLEATIPHTDPEVWYHVRALAFTSTAEGPHSNPYQFKINTDKEEDIKKSCEKIISQTPLEKDE